MTALAAREAYLLSAAESIADNGTTVAAMMRMHAGELDKLHSKPINLSWSSNSICAACGSTNLTQYTVQTKQTAKPPQVQQPLVEISRCSICKRSTKRITSEAVQPRFSEPESEAFELPQTAPKSVIKSSSKKRAKQRQERDSLRAMLNHKSQSTSNFSLMDFMTAGAK